MATVTGITAARGLAIEAASIVDGSIVGSNLILERFNGSTIDAGVVTGAQGIQGIQGVAGTNGISVPAGGAANTYLKKLTSADYDFVWSTMLLSLVLTTKTASYTLTTGDEEDLVLVNSASATVVTVPLNSVTAFPLGTRINVAQIGTGNVSIAGSGGVTLRYVAPLTPNLTGRGARIELIKIGDDEWILDGHGNLATAELGFQTFTPTCIATTSGPNLGTTPKRTGFYIVDSRKRVHGGATIRWDTAGSPTRGVGVYRLGIPVQGVNYDQEDFSPIGSVSFGNSALDHRIGLLHFNGVSSPANTTTAVGAMNGGLFLGDDYPTGTAENIHYNFNYQGV